MDLNLYNTLTRKKEPFVPDAAVIRLYTCGPTVYDLAHIGNLRSFINADVLYRILTRTGLPVAWAMNITDIDDKTIKGAKQEHGEETTVTQLRSYTDCFYDQFLEDLTFMGVLVDDIQFIKVTDVIPQIQAFILELLAKGYAYKAEDGSTYFSLETYQRDFADYGRLVGEKFLEGKKIGARVKVDEYEKENLSDFALWKAWEPKEDAQIYWDHPVLGRGRPGWHIECSVVNKVAFGLTTTTVHTGGIDLAFPHHTNEIAQSQPFYTPFTRYWSHTEHLLVDGKKMAKRDKNFYTLRDITERGFSGLHLRYSFLQASYRVQQNFTWENLEAARQSYHNLIERVADLFSEHGEPLGIEADPTYRKRFDMVIGDDSNMPQALALLWELLKDTGVEPARKLKTIEEFDTIFGLQLLAAARKIKAIPIPPEVIAYAEQREAARGRRDWQEADRLRQEIEKLGFLVKDTTEGPQLSRL